MALSPQAPFQIFFNIYENKKRSGTLLRLLTTLFIKFRSHLELFIHLVVYNQEFIVYQGGARSNVNRCSSLVGLYLDLFHIFDNKKKSCKILRSLITKFMKFTCYCELFIDLAEYYQSFVVYQRRAQKQRKSWLSLRSVLFRFSLIFMTTREGLAR